MRHIFLWITCAIVGILSGCATSIQSNAQPTALDRHARWALLPIVNNTDTPQAALSAESMVEHQLRVRGIQGLQVYPATLTRDSLFEPTERKVIDDAQKWARDQGLRFGITGSVEEWRYKVGIDGEPAVGVTLRVIDLSDGRVVWSGYAAKSGWSRQALSAVAQTVIAELLASMRLDTTASKP